MLEKNQALLKSLDLHNKALQENKQQRVKENTRKELLELKKKIGEAFKESGEEWKGCEEQIWCFGPRRTGPNILLNKVSTYEGRGTVWSSLEGKTQAFFKICV